MDRAWSALDIEFNEDHTTFENIVRDAFIAGAKSERVELTRWRDPKEELPEDNKQVLIKTDRGVMTAFHWGNGEFIIPQVGMGYIDLQPEEIEDDTGEVLYNILGWRLIVELPEDGEK